MILSNISIHEALDRGWIRITPEPSPRLKVEGGPKCPFQTSSVDLRLGSEIAFFREGIPALVDLRKGDFNAMFAPLSETRTLTEDQPFVLRPGNWSWGRRMSGCSSRCSRKGQFRWLRGWRGKAPMPAADYWSTSQPPRSMQNLTALSRSS